MTTEHTHTYQRWKRRGPENEMWYRCTDSKCTHVSPKSLLRGKAALCNKCGKEFLLDPESLLYAKPTCMDCRGSKKAKAYQANKSIITSMLSKLGLRDDGDNDIRTGEEDNLGCQAQNN